MELLTVLDHTILNGFGGFDSICRFGRGGLGGCCCSWLISFNADANPVTSPKTTTVLFNSWIPFQELCEWKLVVVLDGRTSRSLGNRVPFITVLCNALLNR